MKKRFKEGDIVFIETSSYDGYYFKYIGVIKKHNLTEKICDFYVCTAYEQSIKECYKNLEFDNDETEYDDIRLATEEEVKLLADILQKDANKNEKWHFW